MIVTLLAAALVAAAGFRLARGLARRSVRIQLPNKDPQAMLRAAQQEAENKRKQADAEAKIRRAETAQGFTDSLDQMSKDLTDMSARLERKGEQLKAREDAMTERRKTVEGRELLLKAKREQLKPLPELRNAHLQQLRDKLIERAQVDEKEMVSQLIDSRVQDANLDATAKKLGADEAVKADAERRAKRVIGIANERFNMSHQPDKEHPGFRLSDPDIVEKVANDASFVSAFTEATQAELNVSDDGRTVDVRSVDPLKREIGRRTMVYMHSQGVLHPDRIPTVLQRVQKEVDRELDKAADRAVKLLKLAPLEGEVRRLFSRLLYRASYSQNQWHHAVEVAFICGSMASELGLDTRVARRAGLLHDIGKAMTHDHEGSHALLGADVARHQGESEEVANAIAAHHGEEPNISPYAEITAAGDAISGARPGARREIQEAFSSKVQDIERIALATQGVQRVHIMQGGREVRVFVGEREVKADPVYTSAQTGWEAVYGPAVQQARTERGFLKDEDMIPIAQKIASEIEEQLTYPGQIRVTVIRETRAVGTAR
jgi:ribonuclease Y